MELVNLLISAFALNAMGLNPNLEKNFSWMAFPGLIRAIVMLQCVVFAVLLFKPEAATFFWPTSEGIENGEYWRLISWIFFPFVSPGDFGFLSVLFMFIVMRIAFLFNDSLENAWGEVRTSIYVYATIFFQALCLYLSAIGVFPQMAFGNQMFYLAIFFAFATVFPHVEFLLFFVLPVKVWVFALISAAGMLFSAFAFPILFIAYALAYFPYLYWAVPKAWHWRKYRSQITARRVKFQAKSKNGQAQSLHRCHVCQRTEISNPDLEFRVAANGEEYCLDHLDDEDKSSA